jgi:two-component system chemotaxis response regulator CheB
MTGANRSIRRIFVLGGSSGAIEASRDLLHLLPAEFPSPIVIVIHTAPDAPGLLPRVLQRDTRLIVESAADGTFPRPGHVYVAPPNLHLVFEDGNLGLAPGPVENRHLPAIDPLFRSAARCYGQRAVGIILSGYLDDGSVGLHRIKQAGGIAIVQDPADALVPDMPRNALERVNPHYSVSIGELAPLLVQLAGEPVESSAMAGVEAMPATPEGNNGKLSVFTCPECHGTLWELEEGATLRFRCRVGHSFTADTMLEDQSLDVERALWAALRVLEEHAEMSVRLATRARNGGHGHAHRRYSARAEEAVHNASVLRTLLVGASQEPRPARPLSEAEADPGGSGAKVA